MKRFAWFSLGAGLMALVLHFTGQHRPSKDFELDRRELLARHDRAAILQDFAYSTFLIPIADGSLVAWVRPHSLVELMGLHVGDVVRFNYMMKGGEAMEVERGQRLILLHTSVPE